MEKEATSTGSEYNPSILKMKHWPFIGVFYELCYGRASGW